MDREIWQSIIGFVSQQRYPVLPCPYCMEKSLAIDIESINYRKSTPSQERDFFTKELDSELQKYSEITKQNTFLGVLLYLGAAASNMQKEYAKFICFFKCKNCGGDVSAAGTSQCPLDRKNTTIAEKSLLKIEYFSPPVPFFNVGASVPISVKNEVLQSFNHFHSDLLTSGAKLRRSIEKLCSELGFKGKTLHGSISAMTEKFPREAELLHSLKLLGNEATHADSVSEEDLLNAFEIQEYVLGMFERIEAEKRAEEKAKKLMNKFDRS